MEACPGSGLRLSSVQVQGECLILVLFLLNMENMLNWAICPSPSPPSSLPWPPLSVFNHASTLPSSSRLDIIPPLLVPPPLPFHPPASPCHPLSPPPCTCTCHSPSLPPPCQPSSFMLPLCAPPACLPAAVLLCKGDLAKSLFVDAGGMHGLLAVAGKTSLPVDVLAATSNSLLNLSSYIPVQVGWGGVEEGRAAHCEICDGGAAILASLLSARLLACLPTHLSCSAFAAVHLNWSFRAFPTGGDVQTQLSPTPAPQLPLWGAEWVSG